MSDWFDQNNVQRKTLPTADLLPCPFCGAQRALEWDFSEHDVAEWTIICNATMGGCGASVGHGEPETAKACWNRRVFDAGGVGPTGSKPTA